VHFEKLMRPDKTLFNFAKKAVTNLFSFYLEIIAIHR